MSEEDQQFRPASSNQQAVTRFAGELPHTAQVVLLEDYERLNRQFAEGVVGMAKESSDETATPQPDLDAVAKALEPFAQVGGLLFARAHIPNDTVVVELLGINGHNGALTRGHFKAANLAWRALLTYDSSLGSSRPEHLFKEPQPDEFVAPNHHRYQGRDFYGEHAQELAEVHYLRDWKRWAEQQLRAVASWARSINEAINSSNGSHKP